MENKILFVDDDPNVQVMVELFLRSEDYNITFAKNGRSGLKFFKSDTFNLIVTDMQMPEMDGLSMIREVRKIDKHIPVIMVSAYGQENLIREATFENILILCKPFESDELIKAINKSIKF